MFGFGFLNTPFGVEYAIRLAAAAVFLLVPFGIAIEIMGRSCRVK